MNILGVQLSEGRHSSWSKARVATLKPCQTPVTPVAPGQEFKRTCQEDDRFDALAQHRGKGKDRNTVALRAAVGVGGRAQYLGGGEVNRAA